MLHNLGCTMVVAYDCPGGSVKSVRSLYIQITPIVAKLYENSIDRSLRIWQVVRNTPLIVAVCGRSSSGHFRSPQSLMPCLA
ncbi:MAG: hypothetical protein LH613_15815 [Chamaesiphon sp.]|nr:hypothetical protein [Chamaesiphon sp.]